MNGTNANVDTAEVGKFDGLATRWWDPDSEFRPLHDINPARLDYIDRHAPLAGRRVLDVGCGGGLLSEAMAARGARVTGIDMSPSALQVARLHLHESGLDIDYREQTAEALAETEPEHFDTVTCLEMLEHVPDPAAVIDACARLARPGGDLFFSTLNRTPKAWLLAIVGAEHLLRLLPRGTHEYARFIRPSELDAWARDAGLVLRDLSGLQYNPLTRHCRTGGPVDVNYLAWYRKP